ncbi:hypothetical protein SISSUDRAFT_1043901 [Sistotremastrum suecicum HHB10207 ss-3]|uniref:Uncharacterized protein n=1 Tax=Sistotremastrum suecicum HHB10207 ss-3 TaxID=1314776 RepID=A0A166FK61_9AGAM|nr:hypothetical protein SISSUDRAFT_1043901 [Sistotremastrum suecicum HHB10207 ss-3]
MTAPIHRLSRYCLCLVVEHVRPDIHSKGTTKRSIIVADKSIRKHVTSGATFAGQVLAPITHSRRRVEGTLGRLVIKVGDGSTSATGGESLVRSSARVVAYQRVPTSMHVTVMRSNAGYVCLALEMHARGREVLDHAYCVVASHVLSGREFEGKCILVRM